MNSVISDDFKDFVSNEEYFNSEVMLYESDGVTLVYEGKGIYVKKPDAIVNEDDTVSYSGHRSTLSLSLAELTFMTSYFSLKSYYVQVTDNVGTYNYWIGDSSYNNNAGSILCYLKDKKVEI